MCKFTTFSFLCGGTKLKITSPCESAFINYQGIQYCRKDPQAHVNDGVFRDCSAYTYGPGICSNVNCREYHGMLPYELSSKNEASDLIEDDSEFDMSPDACTERETRWFRYLLSTDQQLECFNTVFPVPLESMTEYARVYLWLGYLNVNDWAAHFDAAANASPDEVTWQELNPKYMSPCTLQTATAHHLLPAWVTDTTQPLPERFTNKPSKASKKDKAATQQIRTTTPQMPLYGPFKVPSHRCTPAIGFCKTCGHYHSKDSRDKPSHWSEVLPFHGNDVMRRLEREMTKTGSGLSGENLTIAENANQGALPFPSPFEQQTASNSVDQDNSYLFRQEIQDFDIDMADSPAFPSCYDMKGPASGFDFEQSDQASQTVPPKTPGTSSSELPGMASIEQFNSSDQSDGLSPSSSSWTKGQDSSYGGFGQEQQFDFGEENAAGELMDMMQY